MRHFLRRWRTRCLGLLLSLELHTVVIQLVQLVYCLLVGVHGLLVPDRGFLVLGPCELQIYNLAFQGAIHGCRSIFTVLRNVLLLRAFLLEANLRLGV